MRNRKTWGLGLGAGIYLWRWAPGCHLLRVLVLQPNPPWFFKLPTQTKCTHSMCQTRTARADVDRLVRQLRLLRSTLEVWLDVQRSWMALEPVFAAPDIQRQLPGEARAFVQACVANSPVAALFEGVALGSSLLGQHIHESCVTARV